MKRTQKHLLGRPELSLAVKRIKDDDRPEGVCSFTEEIRHMAIMADWFKR